MTELAVADSQTDDVIHIATDVIGNVGPFLLCGTLCNTLPKWHSERQFHQVSCPECLRLYRNAGVAEDNK